MNSARFLLAILIVFSLASCKRNIVSGSGKAGTVSRNISAFNTIDISAPVTAYITVKEGSACSIEFTGYENVIERIKTEVEGNKLSIFTAPDIDLINTDNIKAVITVPSLSGLSLSGAPDVHVNGNIAGEDFDLEISGSSNVVVENMNVKNLTSFLSGAGSITVKNGSVQHAEYSISGVGNINAFALRTMETIASVSGTGNAAINVEKDLQAHISGLGNIRYKGHPVVSSQTSGLGEVTDAN